MALRNLSRDEVTARSLQSILARPFSDNEIIDGDLLIRKDGFSVTVWVNPDNLIRFGAQWPLDPNDPIPDRRALPIVNQWNDTKIFARASYSDGAFMLDYFLSYEGGVNAINFNESINCFFAMSQAYQKFLFGEED